MIDSLLFAFLGKTKRLDNTHSNLNFTLVLCLTNNKFKTYIEIRAKGS